MGIEKGHCLRPIHYGPLILVKIVVPATCVTEVIS